MDKGGPKKECEFILFSCDDGNICIFDKCLNEVLSVNCDYEV